MYTDLEPLYLYILSRLPIRGLTVFEEWRKTAGSFENIYFNPPAQLAAKLAEIKTQITPEQLLASLQSMGVQILPYYDQRYSKLLREIHDPPPVLFYRGSLVDADEPCVAIVGSRKMSSYGAQSVQQIIQPLITAGITIVSGLAYGVDSAAHSESIKANSRTIAVLGSGVDDETIYPRAHVRLAHDILDAGGLIMSEYPPKTPGLQHHFVARNRIIAGLSLGVVIVECETKSGALITADFAADYNRALYAVPGPIYSKLSEGPHELIKNGAALISSGEEILADLSLSNPRVKQKTEQVQQELFTDAEQRVLECMQDGIAITLDAITERSHMHSHEIIGTITMLELKNIIKNLGVQGFIKVK